MAGKTNRAWIVLLIGFLSQNLAIGLTFGSIGLIIGDLSEEFAASRSTVSFSIAMVTLMMGLASPLVGFLLDRWSIKGVMIIGCLLGATGFWFASNASSIYQFLAAFGLMVGAAVACAGTLSVTKLASNWFMQRPGKAIGFVNLPVLVAIGPPVFGYLMADTGWRGLMSTFSVAFLLLIPILLLLQDAPQRRQPDRNATALPDAADHAPPVRWAESLADRRLWVLVVVGGILLCGGIILITHIIAHATGKGVPLVSASLLVSVNGAAAVVGAMTFGWLADTLSPRQAVTINALCQVLLWPLLLMQNSFAGMAIAVALIGVCAGGAFPALSAFAGDIFGRERVGTVLGQFMLLVIPFNFGAAPLAGYFFDIYGSYAPALLLQAVLCLIAAALLTVGGRWSFGTLKVAEPVG